MMSGGADHEGGGGIAELRSPGRGLVAEFAGVEVMKVEQFGGSGDGDADIFKMESSDEEDEGGGSEDLGFGPLPAARATHLASGFVSCEAAPGQEFLNLSDAEAEGSSGEEDLFDVVPGSGIEFGGDRLGDEDQGDVPYGEQSDRGETSIFGGYEDELGAEYPTAAVGKSHALFGRVSMHREHYSELHEVSSLYGGHRDDAIDPLHSYGSLAGDDVPMLTFYTPKLCSIFEDGHAQIEGIDRDLAGYAISPAKDERGESGEAGCVFQDDKAGVSCELQHPRSFSTSEKAHGFGEGVFEGPPEGGDNIDYGDSSGVEIEEIKVEGQDPYHTFYSEVLPPAALPGGKSRRLSRELGALLGYGRVDKFSMGTTTRHNAKQSAEDEGICGEGWILTDAGEENKLAASDNLGDDTSRIRITRSRATGRIASGSGTLGPESATDVSGKSRGKRSVARSGKQGWGNSNANIESMEVEDPNGMSDRPKVPSLELDGDLSSEAQTAKKRQPGKINKRAKGKKAGNSRKRVQSSMAEEVEEITPIVQATNPDEKGTPERAKGTPSVEAQGFLVVDSVETGEIDQAGKKFTAEEHELGGFVSEKQLSSSVGRRRSTRLKGTDSSNNDGPVGGKGISVTKDAQSSGRRGSLKKAMGPESVQRTEGLSDEANTSVKVEAFEQELTEKSTALETSPVGVGSVAHCRALFVESILQEEVHEGNSAKVKRLDDLGGLDEHLNEDRGEPGPVMCLLDNTESFHNVLDLNNKTEAIPSDEPGLRGGERGVRHESHIGDPLKGVAISKEDTSDLIYMAGSEDPDKCGHIENTNASTAEAQCEAGLQVSKEVELNEGELAKVGVKEEAGFGESNDSIMKARECDGVIVKSNADLMEASSSVTSRDDVAHRASAIKEMDSKGTSSEKTTGFPESVCKNPKNDELSAVAANSEAIHGTSQVRPRRGKSKHAQQPRGEVDHVGEGKGLEARALPNLRSRSRKPAVASQVVVEGTLGEQTGSLSTLEGGLKSPATTKLFEDTRSGKGKRKQGASSGKVIQKDELSGLEADKAQTSDVLADGFQNKKCRKVVVGAAAGSANSPRKKIGTSSKSNAAAKKSEVAEKSSAKGKHGSRKTDCLLGVVECSAQLAANIDSQRQVNQEIGGSGGNNTDVKVESSTGLPGGLARDRGSIAVGEDISSGVTEGEANTTGEKVDESAGANPRAGWVKCDDCSKWRCIPVELAEEIEKTNAHWSCRENPNKEFADCSISQIKSNAEINKELGISEDSFCDEGDDIHDTGDSRPMDEGTEDSQAVWTLIRHNIFKHRSRKHQDVDEAMVCQCTPPEDGEMACGEDCLNRMLNVECLAQQCPCGSACSNQQFQKRAYTEVQWFRCGKKGFGLQVKENVPMGTFIIEYVGEVLDMPSFEVRQKEYALKGQKHFYFMTLSANEVIDACGKGNYGRFINHSCEPNCRTEKWMVDGEVCIGLFAIRDLEEGEEITFDYNFVRVGGAVAKKCDCGAPNCRGFIGVDPDTPCTVVENGSEDGDDPEPIMLQADSDEEHGNLVDEVKAGPFRKARMVTDDDTMDETGMQLGGRKRKMFSIRGSKDMKDSSGMKRVKTTALLKTSSLGLSYSRGLPTEGTGATRVDGGRPWVRSSYQSDVEEKLRELSYQFGGLKNRRDTAKQYLKLLVLTAVSGVTGNGAAACSVRDMSMLLEALLKTDKLGVLKDIMTKNGLQMFHNLIKQFRKLFEKRPILRKLLKVLEHLAKHKVLTVQHIYSCPPRSGMECFSDTLFELTRHDDLEVQNMARTFRRLYVPPRPQRTESSTESKYTQSSLSMHMQNCDKQSLWTSEQVQTPSPTGDSQTVQTDRIMVRPGPQQTPPVLRTTEDSGQPAKPPLVNFQCSQLPKDTLVLQEGLGQLPCTATEGNLATKPVPTKRKRPSRWDTPKDLDAAALGCVPNDTSGRIATTVQSGPTSLSPSEPFLNNKPLQSWQPPKPLGAPLQEARCRPQGGSLETDKTTSAPRGPPSISPSLAQACVPIPPTPVAKSSVCSAPAGIPRPPPGPPPPGQPSVHSSTSLGQPVLVHSGGPQQLLLLPGQPAGPPQILVGMPGQRPMGPPVQMHIGMQVISMVNGMAVVAPIPFNNGQMSSTNMFPGGFAVPFVPSQSGVPPAPHQGVPSLMPMAGAQPLSFGFHPGPPAQQCTLMPRPSYVQWPMMHRGGGPMFAGRPPFPHDGKPLPSPPPLPAAWAKNGPPRMEVSQSPAPTANSEAAEAGKAPVKRAVLASQCSSTRMRKLEPRESDVEAEPPVPGLSPLRPEASQKISQGIAPSMLSQRPNGPHNQWGGRGGECKASPRTEIVERPQAAGSCRGVNEVRNREQQWSGSSHSPGVSEKRDSSQQASYYPGNSRERRGSGESEPGGSFHSWETPECSSFHHHVSAMVRSRAVTMHKIHIKDADRFCIKLTEVVVGKEIKKYQENKSQGTAKPILRSRLLDRVDAFVDQQVEIYNKKKADERRH